jgi:hypothetical protein
MRRINPEQTVADFASECRNELHTTGVAFVFLRRNIHGDVMDAYVAPTRSMSPFPVTANYPQGGYMAWAKTTDWTNTVAIDARDVYVIRDESALEYKPLIDAVFGGRH